MRRHRLAATGLAACLQAGSLAATEAAAAPVPEPASLALLGAGLLALGASRGATHLRRA